MDVKTLFTDDGKRISTERMKRLSVEEINKLKSMIPHFTKLKNVIWGLHHKIDLYGMLCHECKECLICEKRFERDKQPLCNICFLKKSNEKRRKTCLIKYGVDNVSNHSDVKAKKIDTSKERYGVDSPLESKAIKQKIKKTNLERYGYENVFESDTIKQKIKNTHLKIYGHESHNSNNVIRQTRSEKHKRKFSQSISESSRIYYEDVSLLNDLYLKNDKSTSITSKESGISQQMVFLLLKNNGYEINKSNKISVGEKELCNDVNSMCEGKYTIRKNDRIAIKPKEIDIYIEELKLGIEYHGLYWHSSKAPGYDKNAVRSKYEISAEKNIELLQFYESEYQFKKEIVLGMIKSKINGNDRVYARKCEIKNVGKSDTKKFIDENHIQGNVDTYSHSIGLYHNNELVFIMTIGKSRFENGVYEIHRLCSKIGFTVVGGASKCFKYFINTNININSVVSYCDNRFSKGNVYEKMGFSLENSGKTGYYYTKNFLILENRMKYQKHKLQSKLENYDPDMSEQDNMEKNGYYKVHDAGHKKYIWRRYLK